MGRRGLPDRWMDYTNIGRPIPGTRIIPFKTPLQKQALCYRMPSNNPMYFDSQTLLDNCPNLGLVVDFTFVGKPYYSIKPLKDAHVQWIKLKIPGKVIPPKDNIRKFFSIVEHFLARNQNNDKLIGVHCTHGVNRTGYIVCRYMIDQLGVPADQAIADFQSARGHEIEREEYLRDLRKSSWFFNQSLNLSQSQEESSEDEATRTPPYMPHLKKNTLAKSRALKRKSSSTEVATQEIRYADCPVDAYSSFSGLMSEETSAGELSTPSGPLSSRKKKMKNRSEDDHTPSKFDMGNEDCFTPSGPFSSKKKNKKGDLHTPSESPLGNQYCDTPSGPFSSKKKNKKGDLHTPSESPLGNQYCNTPSGPFSSKKKKKNKKGDLHTPSESPLGNQYCDTPSGPFSSKKKKKNKKRDLHTPSKSVLCNQYCNTPSGPFRSKKKKKNQKGPEHKSSKSALGKQYYDSYFQGHPQSQYEPDFYIRGGGGIGPHRPQPRCLPPNKGQGEQPRQYKGPKPFRSPDKKRKSQGFEPKFNTLSPDGFMPENQFGRRRSGRFQPY